MRKRIIGIFTALSMVVSLMPVIMAENEEIQEMDIEWEEELLNDFELSSDNDIQLFAANFTQRTTAPNRSNDYWYKSGINPLAGVYANGNCTWYAWGRAAEIIGSALPAVRMTRTTNVNTGDSRTSFQGRAFSWWYDNLELNNKGTGYKSGQTPAVGAIAVWGPCSTNACGHVAIVEAVNGDSVTISESSYGGVWYTGGNWGGATYTLDKLKYGQTNKKVVMPFLGFIYISENGGSSASGGSSTPVHTHSWQTGYESAHPHRQYRKCTGCGATEYTGGTQLVRSCSSCYPVGNVSLTRSFVRTQKSVTFYRNSVSNANSYTLTLYRNGSQYGTYGMSGSPLTVNGLSSGTYYATLTAQNSNTGQSRSAQCDSFTLVDTYQVSFNANVGTNAPSPQTKIQNENLTLTSNKPTRVHYIFKGWASNKTATEPQYAPGSYYTKNTPITLYAVWEPEKYTINFDMNGGMGTAESTIITYGDTMKMPNTVVRESFYLKGWAKNKNAQNPDYRIGMDYMLDENMTLYAVWGNSTWGGTVASGFAGGDGTEENPYQISNAGELAYLAKTVNEQSAVPEYKYYILTDNINLAFQEWKPIGLSYGDYQYFYGSLDGNGYTISDLSISEGNEGSIGLFGKAKDSEIKNLNIYGEISGMTLSNTAYIGAVIGNADNSNISGCNALYVNISDISNTASSYSYMGAICGYANGEISGCGASESSIAMKDGYLYTGIIAGYVKGSVDDCEVKSSGRLFGSNTETDNLYLGGICGYLDGNAEKCIVSAGHYSNTLKAKQSYIGGVTGYSTGTINLCTAQFDNGGSKSIDGVSYPISIYAEGSNASRIGGIAGYIANGGKVTNCKYDGQSISSVNTAGTTDVGGIAGQVYGNATTKISAQGGESISRSSLPTRSGYTATWYTDANLTKEYDFSQPVTEDMTLYAKWTEGEKEIEIWDGTSEEPAYNESTKTYTVTNGKELAWVSDVTNGVITEGTNFPTNTSFEGYTVELADDIYLNDVSNISDWGTNAPKNVWKSIAKFGGEFEGNNYRINGMYCNGNFLQVYTGLFKILSGSISNLQIKSSYIDDSNRSNLVSETTTGTGIFVGLIDGGTISNCSNYSDITLGKISVGGIAGYMNGGEITNSINYAAINIPYNAVVGGIVGTIKKNAKITNCLNRGNISVSGSAANSFNTAGGIVGYCVNDCTISSCDNSGTVSADYYAGGIVGSQVEGKITYCYNTPRITSSYYAGGIVGMADSNEISICYNIGPISNASYAGGIAGQISGTGIMKYCYASNPTLYNKSSANYTITYTSSKDSSAMKYLPNLTGFDSTFWATNSVLNSGYPYLKSLESNYVNKRYSITVIEDPENAAILNKCFVNVDGILFSESTNRAAVGGAVGYAGLSSTVNSAPATNLLVKADKVSAKTSGSAYKAQAGKVIGSLNYSALDFNNITSFDEMELSAVNTANASNIELNSITGSEKQLSQITQARNLTQIFGPNTYQSLANLEEHPDAVWVVKSGSLPDLYYNLLRDITISETANGVIEVDKTQAVDDEIVTVTATPAAGYQLNKIYVNGEEIDGTTFEVNGDSDIYATFIEETPEYNVRITATDNASASLVNVDAVNLSSFSLMSVEDDITATDGDEIKVNTAADEEYTVDAVYVNGEELAGDSFIITEDSVVTMDVTSVSTDINATTGDATDIGNYFATLSGSVEGDEKTTRYIRYWAKDNPDEVFVTDVEDSSGEYSVVVNTLIPETEYEYQMGDTGEIKVFTTLSYYLEASDDGGDEPMPTDEPQQTEEPQSTDNPTPTNTPIPTDEPSKTHIAGDINGDGKINNQDGTRLLQYLAGWNVDVSEAALDVNGDGKINNQDGTRLRQFLAGWNVEIY